MGLHHNKSTPTGTVEINPDQSKQKTAQLIQDKKYGQYQDFTTGKTSRRKIKWYENILELFQPTLTSKPTHNSTLQLF